MFEETGLGSIILLVILLIGLAILLRQPDAQCATCGRNIRWNTVTQGWKPVHPKFIWQWRAHLDTHPHTCTPYTEKS